MEWEEHWWEASDWAGMRELGAEKSGCRADGAAWRETWREAITFDQANGEPIVERSAHKWACDGRVGCPFLLLALLLHWGLPLPRLLTCWRNALVLLRYDF